MVLAVNSRESDIVTAAAVHAPSYDQIDLWTTAEGILLGGKPLTEHLEVARARQEYDRCRKTFTRFGEMEVAGVRFHGEPARDFARAVEATGAPVRSIVNAWNLARLAHGEKTARIHPNRRELTSEAATQGTLLELLERTSR